MWYFSLVGGTFHFCVFCTVAFATYHSPFYSSKIICTVYTFSVLKFFRFNAYSTNTIWPFYFSSFFHQEDFWGGGHFFFFYHRKPECLWNVLKTFLKKLKLFSSFAFWITISFYHLETDFVTYPWFIRCYLSLK